MSLHALLHMADAARPFTSEELASGMQTNAVVIRRTFAGLRRAKILRSTKGHGGGWVLARPLAGKRALQPLQHAVQREPEAADLGARVGRLDAV